MKQNLDGTDRPPPDENDASRTWNDATRTVWSDRAWLSTVCLASPQPASLRSARDATYETVLFADDRTRVNWRHFRVTAGTREDALHNHELLADMVDADNAREGRKAKRVGADAPRCRPDKWPRVRSGLPWRSDRPPTIPPWVDPETLDGTFGRRGYTQPWARPGETKTIADTDAVSEMLTAVREKLQQIILTDIADRWTRYHEAFNEPAQTDQGHVIDATDNLATRHDHHLSY